MTISDQMNPAIHTIAIQPTEPLRGEGDRVWSPVKRAVQILNEGFTRIKSNIIIGTRFFYFTIPTEKFSITVSYLLNSNGILIEARRLIDLDFPIENGHATNNFNDDYIASLIFSRLAELGFYTGARFF